MRTFRARRWWSAMTTVRPSSRRRSALTILSGASPWKLTAASLCAHSLATGPVPIALPFDPVREPIEAMVEMPEYKAVLIITDVSAYALQDNGVVSEIKRAREVGVSPITASRIELIPVSNETIFLGRNSLNLLVDARISGEAACSLTYVPAHR